MKHTAPELTEQESLPIATRSEPSVATATGELEVSTATIRRFLGVADAEFLELCVFINGRPWVQHVGNYADHVRALRKAETMGGYGGAYQLVNGPVDPALGARYEPGKWHAAWNGRATDRDIGNLRALFLDIDSVRPKGISSTDNQLEEARKVAWEVRAWLNEHIGDRSSTGLGCSGNGFFLLVALEPIAPTKETTARISQFLGLLQKKFGSDSTKIDASVANPARLGHPT